METLSVVCTKNRAVSNMWPTLLGLFLVTWLAGSSCQPQAYDTNNSDRVTQRSGMRGGGIPYHLPSHKTTVGEMSAAGPTLDGYRPLRGSQVSNLGSEEETQGYIEPQHTNEAVRIEVRDEGDEFNTESPVTHTTTSRSNRVSEPLGSVTAIPGLPTAALDVHKNTAAAFRSHKPATAVIPPAPAAALVAGPATSSAPAAAHVSEDPQDSAVPDPGVVNPAALEELQSEQKFGEKWNLVTESPDGASHPKTEVSPIEETSDMATGAVVLTDETFAAFVKSEPFVLVLFYASWCHWSRATLPEFDAVARFMAKVKSRPIVLGKVNCEDEQAVMKSEHILEYPIIKLYIDGRPKQYVGGRRRTQIFAWLNHNLQRDERLDTISHLNEFMKTGAEGNPLVVAVTSNVARVAVPTGAAGPTTEDPKTFDHTAFLHVARSFSEEVLFGEISEPEVYHHFLHSYLLTHLKSSIEQWTPPFIVAMPPAATDPPFVKYIGSEDNVKEITRFVHKYRFPQVLPFEPDTIEDIFDDGRPVCMLLLDGERASKSLTREGLVDPIVAAFYDIAGGFRADIIFAISGNKEAHERRIFTLLGVDDTITVPELRIATFNPSGNGKYYPAQKYKPTRQFQNSHLSSVRSATQPSDRLSNVAEVTGTPSYVFRNSSASHPRIINALVTIAHEQATLRSRQQVRKAKAHQLADLDEEQLADQPEFAKIIRNFVQDFLDDKLQPYMKSEPVPPAAQNAGPVKTFVGFSFQKEVIEAPNDVFVSFGAPWCGHCRKLEPAFKRVASIVKKRSTLVLGKIDATLNELDGIHLSGYPTLLLFRHGSKQTPLMYDGDRTEFDILAWLARNAMHSHLNVKQLVEDLKAAITGRGVDTDTQRSTASVLEEL